MKQSTKKLCDIAHIAAVLIQAMIDETEKMPRAFDAPKTVNAAGILREQLHQHGFSFNEKEKTKGTK